MEHVHTKDSWNSCQPTQRGLTRVYKISKYENLLFSERAVSQQLQIGFLREGARHVGSRGERRPQEPTLLVK